MSHVLGLSFFFHDSAAALVSDGQIVAAAAEERFTRRKHTNEFPKHAIEYCLQQAGLQSINDLDAVVFYEKPVNKLFRVLETLVRTWPRSYTMFTQRLPQFLAAKADIYGAITQHLPGYRGEILFSEHHESHAASAFYCSPYQEAAILTIDGVGEWETTTIGHGNGSEITLDRAIHFPHSVGILYSALTSYLGFKVNDGEWKVMGLAPYGKPEYLEQFRSLVDLKDDGSYQLNMHYFVHTHSSQWTCHLPRWEKLFGFPMRKSDEPLEPHHEDIAHSGQKIVEELILGLARAAKKSSNSENLVIAGGVGLNSVANWKIEEQGIFKNVWIQPAAGDDGGAVGAALVASQQVFDDSRTSPMEHAYFGPEYSDDEVLTFFELNNIPHHRLNDEELITTVADLLAEGKVVGWSRGRMEFGPRALGARSILADATNPNMKELINGKIKFREYFRPFAPVVPLERVSDYFEVPEGTSLPFMLKVPQVRPEQRDKIPAVTHADGSARVQTVTKETNPLYHALLEALGERTGCPVAVNTSFNVRGEPIVCTPKDAYNCFIQTGIDALVINNFLLTEKPEQLVSSETGQLRSDQLERDPGSEPLKKKDNGSILEAGIKKSFSEDTKDTVLQFYKELPFNYYSNAIDSARELIRKNRVKSYPTLHEHLQTNNVKSIIDVGCGAGWFVNSCAHYYDIDVLGVDLNPVVLSQARAVSRFIDGVHRPDFVEANVFEFHPGRTFDVVNSLGVLHHTHDCHAAIKKAISWLTPGGYLHLGLYHLYGRKPFLDHFANMQARGADDEELLEEFRQLNPNMQDETHLRSWYRDQVLHPHETQHTFEEIHALLLDEGLTVEATSINEFKKIDSVETIIEMEKTHEQASKDALYKQKRYYPGFFVVWARK